jgi:hypothetical protein
MSTKSVKFGVWLLTANLNYKSNSSSVGLEQKTWETIFIVQMAVSYLNWERMFCRRPTVRDLVVHYLSNCIFTVFNYGLHARSLFINTGAAISLKRSLFSEVDSRSDVKKTVFIKPKDSLPCSRQLTTGTYTQSEATRENLTPSI